MAMARSSPWTNRQNERSLPRAPRNSAAVSSGSLEFSRNSAYAQTFISISNIISADIFVVDTTGQCKFCTEGTDCLHNRAILPSYVMGATARGEFFESGTLGDYYSEGRYTAGVPIRTSVNTGGAQKIVGFCYVSTPATFISGLPVTFLQTFITAAVIMLIIIIIFDF